MVVLVKKSKASISNCPKPVLFFVAVLIFLLSTLAIAIFNIHTSTQSNDVTDITSSIDVNEKKLASDSDKQWFEKEKPSIREFPVPGKRNDIIATLEKLKWKTAIEVGVQKGLFAKKMLDNWPSCTEYKLVDLWGREEGYVEPGEHSMEFHNRAYKQTKIRVKPHMHKVEFFEMRSTDAAKRIQDNHFDFVYLDARHDYCAVAEDIESYWPKVRPGGILAGHDFIDAQYAVSRKMYLLQYRTKLHTFCRYESHKIIPLYLCRLIDLEKKKTGVFVKTERNNRGQFVVQWRILPQGKRLISSLYRRKVFHHGSFKNHTNHRVWREIISK